MFLKRFKMGQIVELVHVPSGDRIQIGCSAVKVGDRNMKFHDGYRHEVTFAIEAGPVFAIEKDPDPSNQLVFDRDLVDGASDPERVFTRPERRER